MSQQQDQSALARTHEEMRELAELTRSLEGATFYLQVHKRKEYGQLTLRWRKAGQGSHIPWCDIHGLFDKQLPQLKAWYGEIHQRVLQLNAQEKLMRQSIRLKRKSQQYKQH